MRTLLLLFVVICSLCGCSGTNKEYTKGDTYMQITAEEAKQRIDESVDALILDVREKDEYDAGHIPGAVLFPVGTIDKDCAKQIIPDMDTELLVYCRSGNRSKRAAEALVDLGYTNVYEFGGILSWPYEVEK